MPAVTITITSNGKEMNPEYELLSLNVAREFNKVPYAELKLIEGKVAQQEYPILDGDYFEHGKKIEISIRYEGEAVPEELLFSGIVTHQGLELSGTGTFLSVELSDFALKMTTLRKNALFSNKKDSDIIKSLITGNQLTAGSISPTQLPHLQMVQYYASDWDFMLTRAEANGHLILVEDGTVSTQRPEVANPDLVLELGRDLIYDLEIQLDSAGLRDAVTSVAWDPGTQALTKPFTGEKFEIPQGNANPVSLAKAVGGDKAQLMHVAPLHPEELKAWAGAQTVKSRMALIRGWVKVPGSSKIKVGQTLELRGVSQRLGGKNIISGVRHQVTETDWITLIQIGMDAAWFTSHTKVTDEKAAGLLPGVNGLQIGKVMGLEDDPHHEFRVKVNVPAFDEQKGTIWARLASLNAGPERGLIFRPEIGDEVLVGFLNDDPRQAIIIGSMHSSAHKPPLLPQNANKQTGIITREKYQLIFDEEQETISLATSENNHLLIDEKKGTIALEDQHGNKVNLSEKGVEIISHKDLVISAAGDLGINAKGKVKIEGKAIDLL